MAKLLQLFALASSLSVTSAVKPRIIGGEDAEREGFPHLVYLSNDEGSLVCTGTLVSQQVVLTSSHCQWGHMTTAQVGRWNVTNEMEIHETRKISETHVHPDWDYKTLTNDILLLELDAPVEGIPVAKLHKGELSLPEGAPVMAVGYGVDANDKLTDILQVVELEYVSNDVCMNFNGEMPGNNGETFNVPYSTIIADDLMCTHFSDGVPKDFCHGDSGGPLMLKNSKWRIPLEPPANPKIVRMPAGIKSVRLQATISDSRYTQIGIASWGFDCASPDHPGIGQRIGYAWDFIRTWICRIDGLNAPDEYGCSDYIEFNGYPDAGSCDDSHGGFATSCRQRSDCNVQAGACCVVDSCSCKVPEGIERFKCVPNMD
jgi:secreted trypsin-like serine protease